MKGNDGSGNNPSRDEWKTPLWIFEPLINQYKFTFDCCATKHNRRVVFYSEEFEGIEKDRLNFDICWMNPPFSIAWRMFETFFEIVKKGVAIYRCDNFETGIWQKIIFPNASWILIPDRRVSYEGLDGEGARFPSALIGYHVDPPKGIKGTLLRPEIYAELSTNALKAFV